MFSCYFNFNINFNNNVIAIIWKLIHLIILLPPKPVIIYFWVLDQWLNILVEESAYWLKCLIRSSYSK